MNPLVYVYAFIASLVIAYIFMLKAEVTDLENKLSDAVIELNQANTNNSLCKASILSSNKQINDLSIDIKKRTDELNTWKKKKPRVKYKVIYRDIIKDSNLTGECEDVKTIINSVSNINLNSL